MMHDVMEILYLSRNYHLFIPSNKSLNYNVSQNISYVVLYSAYYRVVTSHMRQSSHMRYSRQDSGTENVLPD